MTRIDYAVRGNLLDMTVTGHANYAKQGEPDIVCASVSMLCYQLAQVVKNACDAGQLKNQPIIVLKDGRVNIKCEPTKRNRHDIALAYKNALIGFYLLQHNYPENIIVKN